jgi:hypothetical protein
VLNEYNKVDRFRQLSGLEPIRFEARWALMEWHTDPTSGFRDMTALHQDNARINQILSWPQERRNSYFESGTPPRARDCRPRATEADPERLTGVEIWAHSALMLIHLFMVQKQKTTGDGPSRRLALLEAWQDAVVSDLGALGALEQTIAIDDLFGLGRDTYAGRLCKWGSWRTADEIRRSSLNGAGDLQMLRAMHASHYGIGGYEEDPAPAVLLTEDKGLPLAHAVTREVFSAAPSGSTLVAFNPELSRKLMKVDIEFTKNQEKIFEDQLARAATNSVPQKSADDLLKLLQQRIDDAAKLI